MPRGTEKRSAPAVIQSEAAIRGMAPNSAGSAVGYQWVVVKNLIPIFCKAGNALKIKVTKIPARKTMEVRVIRKNVRRIIFSVCIVLLND
jgi:hypothetical protein